MKRQPILLSAALVLFIAVNFFPFFWILLSSLKPSTQLFAYHPPLWPRDFS